MMKIFNLIRRSIPHSIQMQLQAYEATQEVEHEEIFTDRELTPHEVKKVNQMQAWASRQLKIAYRELNPAVKEGK